MGAPLLIPIVEAIVGGAAYAVVNNYISDTPLPQNGTPTIPTSRPANNPNSGKAAQKRALANFATGIGKHLSDSSTAVKSAVTAGKQSATESATAQSAKTSELLTPSAQSPLLTNQVYLKDSMDGIINALNSNAIVTASVFGTLDSTMSAIASSLATISATLIDISGTQTELAENTGDIPYVDGQNYYDSLKNTDIGMIELDRLRNVENELIKSMQESGSTYSDIKKAVQNYRSTTVPIGYQRQLEASFAGISSAPVSSSGSRSSSTTTNFTANLEVPNLEKWATSQLAINNGITAYGVDIVGRNINAQTIKNEYQTTPIKTRDHLGNDETELMPMEFRTMKDLAVGVSASLENSTTIEELGLEPEEFYKDSDSLEGLLKLFTFNGITDNLQELASGGQTDYIFGYRPSVNLKG